jgi:hypothetical protein
MRRPAARLVDPRTPSSASPPTTGLSTSSHHSRESKSTSTLGLALTHALVRSRERPLLAPAAPGPEWDDVARDVQRIPRSDDALRGRQSHARTEFKPRSRPLDSCPFLARRDSRAETRNGSSAHSWSAHLNAEIVALDLRREPAPAARARASARARLLWEGGVRPRARAPQANRDSDG